MYGNNIFLFYFIFNFKMIKKIIKKINLKFLKKYGQTAQGLEMRVDPGSFPLFSVLAYFGSRYRE